MGFRIGPVEIANRLVLAPMAGVSNRAFREIVRSLGAGLVFAEMVSDKGLIYRNEKTMKLLTMSDKERPLAQQVFGADKETIVRAAIHIASHTEADIIDINMGCPVPKVALRAQAGAALMKDPDRIYDIVSEVVRSIDKPVTAKIRSGWDHNSINAVEVAQRIEAAGAAAITVHGRTRAQSYSGVADLGIIRAVKESVSIPVIGNGDVHDGPSAKRMFDATGCDAIMIGRAALGNPWVFSVVETYLRTGETVKGPSAREIRDMMLAHLDALIELKGERIAILEMRSHGPWYLKGMEHAHTLKHGLSRANSRKEFYEHVDTFFRDRV
ncbi:MAG: tRNA dihydrouridine synthase DusB [Acholeplasmataceae bacterium]